MSTENYEQDLEKAIAESLVFFENSKKVRKLHYCNKAEILKYFVDYSKSDVSKITYQFMKNTITEILTPNNYLYSNDLIEVNWNMNYVKPDGNCLIRSLACAFWAKNEKLHKLEEYQMATVETSNDLKYIKEGLNNSSIQYQQKMFNDIPIEIDLDSSCPDTTIPLTVYADDNRCKIYVLQVEDTIKFRCNKIIFEPIDKISNKVALLLNYNNHYYHLYPTFNNIDSSYAELLSECAIDELFAFCQVTK